MIRGQTREVQKPTVNASASIHNRFDIEVIDAKSGKIRQKAQAENIILDKLWTYMFSSASSDRIWFNYIRIGTGEGTPSPERTKLFSDLTRAAAGSSSEHFDAKLKTYWVKKKITLTDTEYVGENITEVGISQAAIATSLCTHAMLKDMNGNQISIEKTDTDIINIYATVYVHWPNLPSYFHMYGSSSLVKYAAGLTTYPEFPGTGYPYPSLSLGSGSYTYDLQNKTVTIKYPRIPVGTGNDELSPMVFRNLANEFDFMEYGYVPDQIVQEVIATGDGVKTDFVSRFMPIVENSATVFVDGSEVQATVDSHMVENVKCTSPGHYYPNLFIPVNESGERVYAFPFATVAPGDYMFIENRHYQEGMGISAWYPRYGCKISGSNDLVNWSAEYTNVLPEEIQTCKYYKATSPSPGNALPFDNRSSYGSMTLTKKTNIHLASPPPEGAIISMTYTPNCIAKDENHVFDMSMTYGFGEYTP